MYNKILHFLYGGSLMIDYKIVLKYIKDLNKIAKDLSTQNLIPDNTYKKYKQVSKEINFLYKLIDTLDSLYFLCKPSFNSLAKSEVKKISLYFPGFDLNNLTSTETKKLIPSIIRNINRDLKIASRLYLKVCDEIADDNIDFAEAYVPLKCIVETNN